MIVASQKPHIWRMFPEGGMWVCGYVLWMQTGMVRDGWEIRRGSLGRLDTRPIVSGETLCAYGMTPEAAYLAWERHCKPIHMEFNWPRELRYAVQSDPPAEGHRIAVRTHTHPLSTSHSTGSINP